jgi:aldehyde oxidoreductase
MALTKYWLIINGAQRMVNCDPEKDTLAEVLRRLGLTGTKIGCGAGQCGACSVLLNGEVVRACVKKMKAVENLAEVVTIEGIGTPKDLHPLQVAWNTYGAVQCGFCSPGFIVSAKALLDKNSDPTREEVRAWFKKNRNICRCTGYRPIVDAVMAAARVLRGECDIEEITWRMPEDGNAYNTPFPRRESGVARVTGLANYGDDIRLQMPKDALEMAPVLSDVAHAKILGIDDTEALKQPGVVKVVTYKDVKGSNRLALPLGYPRAKATGVERPLFCYDKVHKYGDLIAVVVADTTEHARAAAKHVKVTYELLPEYGTQLEAILPDAIEVHEGVPNLFLQWPRHKGKDTREVLPNCAHVVEGSFFSSREPHLPIEPDCVTAYIGVDDVLTVEYKSQFVYFAYITIMNAIGVAPDKIRIIECDSGGSFGYSVSPLLPALAAACTVAVDGRPVSMTLTYAEHQHLTGKRSPSHANVTLGCDDSGKIQAMEFHIGYEAGAYTKFQVSLLQKSLHFMGFPYNIPNQMGVSFAAFSNFGYGTTYRAFGAVQALTSSEAIMDVMAEKIGMDPFEFRYKNIARPGETNSCDVPFNEYPMEEMMDALRPKYEAAKKKAAELSTDKVKHGVGVAWGGYCVGEPVDNAQVALAILPDGSFTSYSTWQDVGQHAEASQLLHTYTALRPMNVPYEKIKVEMNDTRFSPNTGISGGSRSHVYAGLAILDAAEKLMNAMRKEDGSYRTYEEMVAEEIPTRYDGAASTVQGRTQELDTNNGTGKAWDLMMYNLFMVEASVDLETGKTKVNRITSNADIGVIGNVLGVEGQAYGGIMHSVGFALKEDYSDMKKHDNMVGAGIIEIDEFPDDIELMWHESYREDGPHGSAGCSENFQSSCHVAVLNAIHDATGVRVYELPAKPEVVLAALQGKNIQPEKYYLGGELYDVIDELDANPIPEEINMRFRGHITE